jgi:hypothetical protein
LIIADDANTVMDVVAGCDCESQPLAETTNRIPTAIVRFNRPRIAVHDTDSYSANYVRIRMSCSLFRRRVERFIVEMRRISCQLACVEPIICRFTAG